MTLLQTHQQQECGTTEARPRVGGKFVFAGDHKLYLRGVTYGTFRPDEAGNQYGHQEVVERDFAQMAAMDINAVRTYTVPPRWLLDCAQRHGLRVMVGLPWEQHVAFLDDAALAQGIEERVRAGVRACSGHPAVLCYAIGNEIPAPIVRWHGCKRVQRFLEKLYRAVKSEDPEGLVTYVNYPTTEYLELPFLDIVSFNVYLEAQEDYEAYLARLQSLAGDRPLVMAEIGLDSHTNGVEAQARSLEWQVRGAFAAGCAGAFVFAWTDEWHRGGYDVEDWDFGLTDRARRPKPALEAVRDAFAEVPLPHCLPWPSVSVVVCTYNGADTIRACLEGLGKLEYPDYEVIVVDDGSTDETASIAAEYPVRLISTPNNGLSSARNTGLQAATGEIVAYTDDDARPDPHWLSYLATVFMTTDHAGVGGPNITPREVAPTADCVANSPGNPTHVLLSDREAEHIPGCNMAFRRAALEAIGGFDPQFSAAGDDVDICWRLQERGWTLGFSPAAVVWHHRRPSVRAYLKQQRGYGKAEAMLERKWPEKYNAAGHFDWGGRLYGQGVTVSLGWFRERIYGGSWGSAPFQSVYGPPAHSIWSLPLMPEWYLLILVLAGLAGLGIFWEPLLLALPLLLGAVAAPIAQAGLSASRARFVNAQLSRRECLRMRLLTAALHLLQPMARLWGRLSHGLTPWRRRGVTQIVLPIARTRAIWCERWASSADRIRTLQFVLGSAGAVVLPGGEFDHWDLEVRGGMLGSVRLLTAIEEHGGGRQYIRVRCLPRASTLGMLFATPFAALSAWAGADGAWIVCATLGAVALILVLRTLWECSAAMGAALSGVHAARETWES